MLQCEQIKGFTWENQFLSFVRLSLLYFKISFKLVRLVPAKEKEKKNIIAKLLYYCSRDAIFKIIFTSCFIGQPAPHRRTANKGALRQERAQRSARGESPTEPRVVDAGGRSRSSVAPFINQSHQSSPSPSCCHFTLLLPAN